MGFIFWMKIAPVNGVIGIALITSDTDCVNVSGNYVYINSAN